MWTNERVDRRHDMTGLLLLCCSSVVCCARSSDAMLLHQQQLSAGRYVLLRCHKYVKNIYQKKHTHECTQQSDEVFCPVVELLQRRSYYWKPKSLWLEHSRRIMGCLFIIHFHLPCVSFQPFPLACLIAFFFFFFKLLPSHFARYELLRFVS